MADQWEYMWVHVKASNGVMMPNQTVLVYPITKPGEKLEEYMIRLGDDRWESVGILPLDNTQGGSALFFKRPKS
jgi:hypothetical protein